MSDDNQPHWKSLLSCRWRFSCNQWDNQLLVHRVGCLYHSRCPHSGNRHHQHEPKHQGLHQWQASYRTRPCCGARPDVHSIPVADLLSPLKHVYSKSSQTASWHPVIKANSCTVATHSWTCERTGPRILQPSADETFTSWLYGHCIWYNTILVTLASSDAVWIRFVDDNSVFAAALDSQIRRQLFRHNRFCLFKELKDHFLLSFYDIL